MRFRLSTLLIIVTGAAILAAQYPYFYELGFRGSGYGIYAPTGRFLTVGLIELALVAAWPFAKRGRFPWKTVLALSLALQLILAAIVLDTRRDNTNFDVFVVNVLVGIFLTAVVAAFYGSFVLIRLCYRRSGRITVARGG